MKDILRNYYRKFNKNYQAEFLLKKEFEYFTSCKRILDVGCGTGDFISIEPTRVVGVDSNSQSVKFCKKNGFDAIHGNAIKLPFKKNSFDGVHASHLIEHLYPKDAYKMLLEVSRVLEKGGIFVLSTPILWKGFYNDFTHARPYPPESILRYLVDQGEQKTFGNFPSRFEKIDLYWRFRPIKLFGKVGHLLSSLLYQFGIHSLTKDAYTLVLRKKS